jgi:hypothetical protein
MLAVPVIIITTALGTAAFATITSNLSAGAKGWFGALSLVAAVLAALQLNFRYLEKAEKHKYLGSQYGGTRRSIESILALSEESRGDVKAVLSDVKSQLDRIGSEGDAVSRRIYERTVQRLAVRDRAKQEGSSGDPSPSPD